MPVSGPTDEEGKDDSAKKRNDNRPSKKKRYGEHQASFLGELTHAESSESEACAGEADSTPAAEDDWSADL